MVKGFDSFKAWFQGYEEQYTIIGGTACDILMAEEGMDFRATKDIDLVLILEAMTPEFGIRLWEYIVEGQYQHCNKSMGHLNFTDSVSLNQAFIRR
jgi:predicted nucleotidyltransferase